ncbi:hypothetical protein Q7C36_023046 [Tachysurus vachellii]|uniref:Uncharacterized protein n=1 Tax=Tachysurus vachellii TaxID=175792 RepID=A0AA88IE12_TACVA|nr:hypothetical protein Q7C36_023046 [Tachysurus vachellii]
MIVPNLCQHSSLITSRLWCQISMLQLHNSTKAKPLVIANICSLSGCNFRIKSKPSFSLATGNRIQLQNILDLLVSRLERFIFCTRTKSQPAVAIVAIVGADIL